jgi:hypothetical protein
MGSSKDRESLASYLTTNSDPEGKWKNRICSRAGFKPTPFETNVNNP